eukprot:gene287-374_t
MIRTAIQYFSEDVAFTIPHKRATNQWIRQVIRHEAHQLGYLCFIFCSDPYLYQKNLQYLQHDTLTDVITFNYAEQNGLIEGEVYISIERVAENATMYQVGFLEELYTVMIHGVLHLLGYQDETAEEKALMRSKEQTYMLMHTAASNHAY